MTRGFKIASQIGEVPEASRYQSMKQIYEDNSLQTAPNVYSSLCQFLNYSKATNILDLGGNLGIGKQKIEENFPDKQFNFVLQDISQVNVDKAKQKYPGIDIKFNEDADLAYDSNSFDIITHNGILEVIDGFKLSIDESFRVLKPGGMIGFSVFGRMGVSNALRLYKRVVMKLDLRFEVPQPRIQFSDPQQVRLMLKQAGFSEPLYFFERYHHPQLNQQEIFDLYYRQSILVKPVQKENKMRMFQEILEQEIEQIFEINRELLTMEQLVVFAKKETE